MLREDILKDLESSLEVIKNKGHTVISPAALEAFISKEKDLITTPSLGERQLREENKRELVLSARATDPAESYKAAIEAGQTTINIAILVNGGAAVAVLAFLGNVLSRPGAPTLGLVGIAVVLYAFALGVRAAALASFNRYHSQDAFTDVLIWAATGDRSRDERDSRRQVAEEFRDKAVEHCFKAFRSFVFAVGIAFGVLVYWSIAMPATSTTSTARVEHAATTNGKH